MVVDDTLLFFKKGGGGKKYSEGVKERGGRASQELKNLFSNNGHKLYQVGAGKNNEELGLRRWVIRATYEPGKASIYS